MFPYNFNAEYEIEGVRHGPLAEALGSSYSPDLEQTRLILNLPQCLRVIPSESSGVAFYTFRYPKAQGKLAAPVLNVCASANSFLISRKRCGPGAGQKFSFVVELKD